MQDSKGIVKFEDDPALKHAWDQFQAQVTSSLLVFSVPCDTTFLLAMRRVCDSAVLRLDQGAACAVLRVYGADMTYERRASARPV